MVNPRNVETNLNLLGDSVNISILTSCSSSPDLNGDDNERGIKTRLKR